MSKTFKITVAALLAVMVSMFVVALYAMSDYPTEIIITTNPIASGTVYYINGQEAGSGKGLCKIIRSDLWTVTATREGKSQRIEVGDKGFILKRFSISDPEGDDVGLQVRKVDNDENLRREFKCPWAFVQ